MICRVRGELVGSEGGRIQVMTAAGIGYEILVSGRTIERLPLPGEELDVHTALVARDDSLELFGFDTSVERELFLRLQGASGVGPRLALAILGTLPSGRVVRAIKDRDHTVLQMVSGVGRKTAERITLELADRMDGLEAAAGSEPDGSGAGGAALDALRALGYSFPEAERALTAARSELSGSGRPPADTEELIRLALQRL